tara:strand:+ start:47 stop:292 length:246 start_codon:yes stop_codon:yes gene_type:complete
MRVRIAGDIVHAVLDDDELFDIVRTKLVGDVSSCGTNTEVLCLSSEPDLVCATEVVDERRVQQSTGAYIGRTSPLEFTQKV